MSHCQEATGEDARRSIVAAKLKTTVLNIVILLDSF